MKTEILEVPAALESGLKLPFAWVHTLSAVTLGPVPEAVDLTEVIEARFFNEQEEIRILRVDDMLKATCLTAESSDHLIEETQNLLSLRFGEQVTVCHTLDFDEDGQAYIACSRLTGWKGGNV